MTTQKINLDYTNLLNEALTVPGVMNAAYRAFHNYSIGNQMLAMMQLLERGMKLSPIASFNQWREKGRSVKKGQKAIALYMPVTVKDKEKQLVGEIVTKEIYIMKNNWFSYEQTQGAEIEFPEVKQATWNKEKALQTLEVTEISFDHTDGNMMGYAIDRKIAVNPLNPFKHKTIFHELAHIVLGHTAESNFDVEGHQKSIKEAEAESVAYILISLLELEGQAESRDYIQAWLSGQPLPEKSAVNIFKAANKILKAGE